jgi:cAMP phosphodiesterase
MIRQVIVTRYVEKNEDFILFVKRVTKTINLTTLKGDIINVSYPDTNTAVIVYKEN